MPQPYIPLPSILKRYLTSQVRAFHANKLYATELLAMLLQQNVANQLHLGKADGILALLTAASHYKRREPQDLEVRLGSFTR